MPGADGTVAVGVEPAVQVERVKKRDSDAGLFRCCEQRLAHFIRVRIGRSTWNAWKPKKHLVRVFKPASGHLTPIGYNQDMDSLLNPIVIVGFLQFVMVTVISVRVIMNRPAVGVALAWVRNPEGK